MTAQLSEFILGIESILEDIISLKNNISYAHTSVKSSKEDELVLQQQNKDFKEKTQMYNRLFQEEEISYKKMVATRGKIVYRNICLPFSSCHMLFS